MLRYGHASLCFSACRKPFSKHADISGRFAIKSTTGGTRTRNPRLTRHLTQVEVHRLGGRCLIHWATVAVMTGVPPFLARHARALLLASRLQEYTLAPCERLVYSNRPIMFYSLCIEECPKSCPEFQSQQFCCTQQHPGGLWWDGPG